MLKKAKIFQGWICGYDFDDPRRNGEYRFLRSYVADGMVIFDVGANVGDFSAYALSLASNFEVHCFEPVRLTYERLRKRFPEPHGNARLFLNPVGLSDHSGEAAMKIYGEYAGTNSLYNRQSAVSRFPSLAVSRDERIRLTTLDAYVKDHSIGRIDLLKIDVEGHELKVIQGAAATLFDGRVRCIQFEYGGCFLDSGARLAEVFSLLTQNGFDMFRLLPFGKLRIRSFHSRLENYRYSNWLAIRP